MIAPLALRLLASALRGLSVPLLLVGRGGGALLTAAGACDAAAREWTVRLWARGGERRAETEERSR